MEIGLAQINTTVGDLEGNARLIADAARELETRGADIVLTPELALTGYPPQDLLFLSDFVPASLRALEKIHAGVGSAAWIVGCVLPNPDPRGRGFFNAAAILEKGKPARFAHKTLLPTYDVFNETRYFEPCADPSPLEIRGTLFGVTICEDIWTPEYLPRRLYAKDPVATLVAAGAKAILNLSASPFQVGKPASRTEMIRSQAKKHGVPFYYCNAVGGNDQLVFDGNSLAVGADGTILRRWVGFCSENALVSDPCEKRTDNEIADLHDALVIGLRDYARKCGFQSAVLGLSGGIDSAVVACIAAEALGPDKITGVAMPSQFSSPHSVEDALALAKNLGIACLQIPIRESFDAFKNQMQPAFAGRPEDTTEENMQARLRGLTLMSLSNKFGSLLLTTGNKSELAVGYCTLYGDMCGGLAVISDVPKTMVYRLAEFLNRGGEKIPQRTIEKPPSAELRPDQTDQDTLPPYDTLDAILKLHIEENLGIEEIAARGFDRETVRWVARKVDFNEYKREQAAPGLKVTSRAFGIGRRMPIAQGFQRG
ncbi:MAG: NAD+ synthase [Verrucomicrobia bacterium]|nr:NAD+ synthase [Verrucomicrobiota bacterium]